jgi:hypothetical protein
VNKIEKERKKLRCPLGLESRYTSGLIQCVIELKMVNVQDALETTEADANRLEDRMLASCCKLGQEKPKRAYVVGLSRGPLPDLSRARSMVANCLQLYKSRYAGGSLCVLVATPEHTVLGGDWPQELEFPNVAVLDDLPVSNEDTSGFGHYPGFPAAMPGVDVNQQGRNTMNFVSKNIIHSYGIKPSERL